MANLANDIIKVSLDEVGYIEKASNSNLDSKTGNKGTNNFTKYSRDINKLGLMGCQGQAWCATSQFWIEVQAAGLEQALKNWNMTKTTYVGYNCFDTYNAFDNVKKTSKTPKLGCLVIFTFSHMGRVVDIDFNKKTFTTIEGNTSAKTYDRNGGMVAKKTYYFNDPKIKGFCIIDYDDAKNTTTTTTTATTKKPVSENVKSGQKWLNSYYGVLFNKHLGALLEMDGEYGTKTRAAAICTWKDIVNRKYGFKLTPSNTNFLASSKDAARKAKISKGDSGTLPMIIKLILSAKGFYAGRMDTEFEKDTESAVKEFQRSRGLSENGIVDDETWYALFN